MGELVTRGAVIGMVVTLAFYVALFTAIIAASRRQTRHAMRHKRDAWTHEFTRIFEHERDSVTQQSKS